MFRNSSIGNSLHFGYETRNNNGDNDNLATLSWRYRSPQKTRDGRNLWDFDVGYGIASQGSAFIASASTAFIPGLNLRLRYQGVSATSNSDNFRIELSPSFSLQPRLTLGDSRYERFRSEGGLLIQPFLDKNGNGKLDKNEKIHTEDAELLLTVNNKPIKSFGVDTSKTKSGILIKLTPNNYRVDLDPAGYPIDWKPTQTAYAVEVAAGGYTPIQIPFTPSYTVAGTLTNAEGKPIGGARVEAVFKDKNKKIVSVTNGAGIFFLENLQQGTYNLLINDKTAKPEQITIDANSEPMQEINLKL
ncbi:MAG: carboxypeptidase-like regulatory domain-containing protein [Nostocaceae cyanobacterium]|nr:carboxypeptidase-like regulatory domain-containing protein [Nostocaceae cyanobacterium]